MKSFRFFALVLLFVAMISLLAGCGSKNVVGGEYEKVIITDVQISNSDVSKSKITSSDIYKSRVEDSDVSNSEITQSFIEKSFIQDSVIESSTLTDCEFKNSKDLASLFDGSWSGGFYSPVDGERWMTMEVLSQNATSVKGNYYFGDEIEGCGTFIGTIDGLKIKMRMTNCEQTDDFTVSGELKSTDRMEIKVNGMVNLWKTRTIVKDSFFKSIY